MASAAGNNGTRGTQLHAIVLTAEEVSQRLQVIRDEVLQGSKNIREPNFERIGVDDLQRIYQGYDRGFFGGLLEQWRNVEDRAPLDFRFAPRMTRTAGTTTRLVPRGRRHDPTVIPRYTIAIGSTLLFENFRGEGREVLVGGLVVRDRLEALQRIMEHEILHLAEFLAWRESNCKAPNFQRLSRALFAHDASVHELMTPRERAAVEHGIRLGDTVCFDFNGKTHQGIVNRVTRRATVLVEDPNGRPFSNGKKYAVFYVPTSDLRKPS
ncbi:MAG: SprT-like family protein [Isosphaeraceae bacterium]